MSEPVCCCHERPCPCGIGFEHAHECAGTADGIAHCDDTCTGCWLHPVVADGARGDAS
jgi:hypothetical protein